MDQKTESGRASEVAELGEAEASAPTPCPPLHPTQEQEGLWPRGHVFSVTCRESVLWHAGSTARLFLDLGS